MNAYADLLPQIPAIVKSLPGSIDQRSFLSSSKSFPVQPSPLSIQATLPVRQSLILESWDTYATTVSSPLDNLTGEEHLQRSARFSKRCGCSTTSLIKHCPNSMRLRCSKKTEKRQLLIGCEGATGSLPPIMPVIRTKSFRRVTVLKDVRHCDRQSRPGQSAAPAIIMSYVPFAAHLNFPKCWPSQVSSLKPGRSRGCKFPW
jgi:hypothetical protein